MESKPLNVQVYPGGVVHSMDHFVLDLRLGSRSTAYLTLYATSYMPGVGAGLTALLKVDDGNLALDLCLADSLEIGKAMQARLRALTATQTLGIDLTVPPVEAHLRRTQTEIDEVTWIIESADHQIEAKWTRGEQPFWVSAPKGCFHPTRDYVATMVSFWGAELVVNNRAISGAPYDHPLWEERLGRRFSSCHAALAETALEGALSR